MGEQKDGRLDTKDVFRFPDPKRNHNDVVIEEKGGDFTLSFGLFDPDRNWHESSYFHFECKAQRFEPSDYPEQLCGNGTKNDVKGFKNKKEWKEYRIATLFLNVFSSEASLTQTDRDSAAASNVMTNRCGNAAQQYQASALCWPLLGDKRWQRKLSRNGDNPIFAFRNCVEFVCSKFKDGASCRALSEQLDSIPCLKGVSEEVDNKCGSKKFNCN